VLATCPFCDHTLLLVSSYRRGARRICDKCDEFSEFDGTALVPVATPSSMLPRPPAKAGPTPEAEAGLPRIARAG
jgi:hypothetical protein